MNLVEGENARWCKSCDTLKSFEYFGKAKRGKYGLRAKCNSCRHEYYKKKRDRNELVHKTKKNIERFRDLLHQSKFCSKCEKYKKFEKFSDSENCLYGLQSICKKCVNKNSAKWYGENRERVLESQKQYQQDNPEKVRKQKQKWLAKNPNFRSEYYQENKDKFREYQKKYYKNNKEKISEAKRIRANERYEEDLEFRLKKVLRTRLYKAVKREYKSGSSVDMLGCSVKKLKSHLKEQFEDGMSWNNYGEWHIDHIKPCAAFDLTNPQEQKECFHYTNLQPLWGEDNLIKSDTYDE